MTTGKNKEQFEKWLKNGLGDYITSNETKVYPILYHRFNDLPLSMQWGVYLEYYDSIGISIETYVIHYNGKHKETLWEFNVHGEEITPCESRQEAQTEALKKADEIANSRL